MRRARCSHSADLVGKEPRLWACDKVMACMEERRRAELRIIKQMIVGHIACIRAALFESTVLSVLNFRFRTCLT